MMLSILCFNVQYAASDSSGLLRHSRHGEQRGKRLLAFSLHAHVFVFMRNEGTVVNRCDAIRSSDRPVESNFAHRILD